MRGLSRPKQAAHDTHRNIELLPSLDHRETDIQGLVKRITAAAMDAPKSNKFRGYWQRAA